MPAAKPPACAALEMPGLMSPYAKLSAAVRMTFCDRFVARARREATSRSPSSPKMPPEAPTQGVRERAP